MTEMETNSWLVVMKTYVQRSYITVKQFAKKIGEKHLQRWSTQM